MLPQQHSNVGVLSHRERQIMLERKNGLLYKEISGRLNISISTVKHHASNAFRKLGVQSSLQAVSCL